MIDTETTQEEKVVKANRETINLETAKITWKDLEVLYKGVLMLRSHGYEGAANPPAGAEACKLNYC